MTKFLLALSLLLTASPVLAQSIPIHGGGVYASPADWVKMDEEGGQGHWQGAAMTEMAHAVHIECDYPRRPPDHLRVVALLSHIPSISCVDTMYLVQIHSDT